MATTHDPLSTTHGTETGSSTNDLKSKVNDATSHVKHTASEFGRSAMHNIDRNLKSAAGALESTASMIRSKAPAAGKTGGLATTAADKLDSTARYFRDHDAQQMVDGMGTWARRNPGAALGMAAGIGFLIGLTMKRDRHSY